MKVISIIKLQFLPKLLPFSKFSTNSSSNCLLIRLVVFEIIQNCGNVLQEARIHGPKSVRSGAESFLKSRTKYFQSSDRLVPKPGPRIPHRTNVSIRNSRLLLEFALFHCVLDFDKFLQKYVAISFSQKSFQVGALFIALERSE